MISQPLQLKFSSGYHDRTPRPETKAERQSNQVWMPEGVNCFTIRTATGKGSGLTSIPVSLAEQCLSELQAFILTEGCAYWPERSGVLIPGPRGGLGPNSLAGVVPVYVEGEPIFSYSVSEGVVRFHAWWGRGRKPQWVRVSDWPRFLREMEYHLRKLKRA